MISAADFKFPEWVIPGYGNGWGGRRAYIGTHLGQALVPLLQLGFNLCPRATHLLASAPPPITVFNLYLARYRLSRITCVLTIAFDNSHILYLARFSPLFPPSCRIVSSHQHLLLPQHLTCSHCSTGDHVLCAPQSSLHQQSLALARVFPLPDLPLATHCSILEFLNVGQSGDQNKTTLMSIGLC